MSKFDILVYAECDGGHIAKVSLEALNAAKAFAEQQSSTVAAVLVNSADATDELVSFGATEIIQVEAQSLQAECVADVLSKLYVTHEADYLMIGSSRDGKEIAARSAATLNVGSITDVTELDSKGWVRAVYGGSLSEIVKDNGKAVISVRSGSFGKPVQTAVKANISNEAVVASELKTIVREVVTELSEDVNLEDAEVVVAGGRGMGSADNFQLVNELAELLGGVVGASRPAIEDGWVARNHQIGQSGKIVAPKLYIACGISGAAQHVSGVMGSGCIVAINKDADAPIFDIADIGIVGNVSEILPLMIEEIKARR